MYFRSVVIGTALALGAGAAWSHGDGSHEKKAQAKPAHVDAEEHAFGRAGDPKKVSRTIDIGMDNSMHFTPGDLVVKRGETIRFKVRNDGQIMHEMVIGTMKELNEHAALMRKFPGMEHDEPYMAHVAPGGRDEIVWQFTQAGTFHYACLIPGHLEAGMIAKITVK
jgi:uncharacterized cupredoxin-like copper-binding protein